MDKKNIQKEIVRLFQPVKYVFMFGVLLISFHFIYKYWAGPLGFFPLAHQVDQLFSWASLLLLNQSTWVLDHVFQVNFYITEADQAIRFQSNSGRWVAILVSPECTSLKQWMHWLFIMFLFPGPWKHKLWYVPLGLVIIEWVNVFRVVGLSLAMLQWPSHFHFFHDYIFKTFFYLMIFLMWVIWVEVFVLKKKKSELI